MYSSHLPRKKRTYILTSRGELAIQVLNALRALPRTKREIRQYVDTHHNVISALLKSMLKSGFVTELRSIRPARKILQLTRKGKAVKEKLED